MGFWIYMLLMNLLNTFTLIGFGKHFMRKAPKEINEVFGYRTPMSMKNKDTWEFAHKYCGKIWYLSLIHICTGWGTLERQRCEKEGEGFPSWLEFEDSALGAPQYPWMFLLENGFLPELDVMEAPKSWMVDAKFEHLLRHSLACLLYTSR